MFVRIEGWTSAANGQAYVKIYSTFGSEFMWTGSVWSNGTAYSSANQPVVNIDASGNWSGWLHAKHNDAIGTAVSVRAAKVGDTGVRLTSGSMTVTSLNMQGTGNGGWITRTSSPVADKSIVAYAGGIIAGSYRTEENGIAEGYAYASGGFKVAVPEGLVDSLVVLNDDGSRDRSFVGPWSIVAGQETEAALDGSSVGRGSVQLSPAELPGGAPQDLRIVVRGEAPFVITDVRVAVPASWSWSRLPADITYSGGGGPVVDVSGDTMRASGLLLGIADSAAFTIHSIIPPDTTALYHFFSSTGTHPDSILPVATQPSAFVHSIPLSISTVRESDANGVPLRNNTLATIRGIVTVANEFGGPSYIQDNTGGMAVFGSSFSTAVAAGDEVVVSGLVQPFNGLLEIVNPRLHLRASSGNVVEPLVVTAADIVHDGAGGVEVYEGRLVRVNNVLINGTGVWGANMNYGLTDATGSTEIRIDNGTNLIGLPIPSSTTDVIGVVGQYVTASPFVGGYQIMPRSAADVLATGPGISSVPRETDLTPSSFRIEWTTALPGTSRLRYGRTSAYELGVIEPDTVGRTLHNVSVTGLEAATIYHVQVFSVSGPDTSTAGGIVVSTASPAEASGILRAYFNKSAYTDLVPADPAADSQDLVALLVGKIASARKSVDAAVYNLSGTPGTNIAQALIAAKQRGLRVRVICEQDNRSNSPFNSLASAGVPLIADTYDPVNAGAGLMHNKFFVIDGYGGAPESVWVWTGSWNPSLPGTNDDYQNVVEVQDPALAGAFTLEFDEMWGSSTDAPNQANARFGARKTDNTPHHFVIGGRPVSCYFSPSDDATARIIEAISTADHSLHFALLTFTRSDIAGALLARRVPGFALSGVMDNGTDTGSQYDYLVSQGVDIRLKAGSGLLHHKYAVLDAGYPNSRPMVITGSHNWTNSAENTNSENTLIIEDARLALHFIQEFAARYYQFGGSDTIRADVETVSSEVPAATGLLQNYPNPFNRETIVGFKVRGGRAAVQRVSLKVYDVLGREAATLVDAPLAAGEYRIAFDASGLASGMYVYVLRAGQFRDAKTMVLVR